MQKRIPMFASLLSLATVAVPTAPKLPNSDVVHVVAADSKAEGNTKNFLRMTKVSHLQNPNVQMPHVQTRSGQTLHVPTRFGHPVLSHASPGQTRQAQTTQPVRPHSAPTVAVHPKWVPMMATWYDGEEGINGTGFGITKSGERVKTGVTIAVDPTVIPLGTWVEVKFSNGTSHRYKAEDIGGNIHGAHIDIFDASRSHCLENGVQQVLVERLG